MSTGINWTDETWNPLVGCKAVSLGCDNCYAAREASGRLSGHPLYAGLATDGVFGGEVRLIPERLDQPLRWKRPRKIFVNSMSDLFHPDVPDEFVAEVFAVMALAARHTFQVLTKRPQRMASLLSSSMFADLVTEAVRGRDSSFLGSLVWPLGNVWLGTSIESNRYVWRADHLRKTPAAIRFLSCEPLLGPLPDLDLTGIDWVIVGGESGPGARSMHPQWIRDIRDRCLKNLCENCQGSKLRGSMGLDGCVCGNSPSGDETHRPGRRPVAFLLKQWGEWAPGHGSTSGSTLTGNLRVAAPWSYFDYDGVERGTNELNSFRIPADWAKMARVGKRSAGRELDEQVWDQYPWPSQR